jgi:carbon starvation protein
MTLMLVMPLWALGWQLFNPATGWALKGQYLLTVIGLATIVLQVWMVAEAVLMIPRAKGVLEEALPPLKPGAGVTAGGGRSC